MVRPGMFGCDLTDLARHIVAQGPRKTLSTSRRVRVIHGGSYVVDTTNALYVWEHDGYPQFYVPHSALLNCERIEKKEVIDGDGKPLVAVATLWFKGAEGKEKENVKCDRALSFYDDEELGPLAGLFRLEFGSLDQWFEEDAPIYVHPKDPYKRVDTLASSRPIEVRVGGKSVAKSAWAVHLFETGLPTRFYLPLSAVDPTVLRHSELVTSCPYKGDAQYYHVEVGGIVMENLVWYYRLPTHESAAIAGLVCFYNEKVDIVLDGETL